MSENLVIYYPNHYRPQYCFCVTTGNLLSPETTFSVQVLYRAGASGGQIGNCKPNPAAFSLLPIKTPYPLVIILSIPVLSA